MAMPSDRRSRKRLATRLFLERRFDHVTVDEIAAAADVARMTVFNHYPRKEDMLFNSNEKVDEMLREALRQREPRVVPIETLRRLSSACSGTKPLRRMLCCETSLHENHRGERNPQGAG